MTHFLKTKNWELKTKRKGTLRFLANCLMVTPNEIYYSDPGIEAFRKYFKDHVAAGAVAVDTWENYHCKCGEIHCGTAAVRTLPTSPPWWENDMIKAKWKDEK